MATFTNITGSSTNNDDNIWCAASDGNLIRVQEIINTNISTANAQDETGYSPM